MPDFSIEMNFCRRCGSALTQLDRWAFKCENGHMIFLLAAPCVGLILLNDKNEILLLERAIEPGKGSLDVPGGFCDGAERFEDTMIRETREEIGLEPSDYTTLQYVDSVTDHYEYGGETEPVLDVFFSARITSDKAPVAADDAARLEWMPLTQETIGKIYFAGVRAVLEKFAATLK